MKTTFAVLSAVAITAFSTTVAFADVTQQQVIGQSDHPVYTVKVRATNGQIYICKPEVTTLSNGEKTRECVQEDGLAALLAGGTGIGGGGALAGGLLVTMLVNNSSSSTTTSAGG